MAKVLVIRKTDKTIHQVPLANKALLLSFNNRLPENQKWSFEEMDEKEAKQLPFIDKEYVTAGEAIGKLKTLEAANQSKDDEIAQLRALLAAKTGGNSANNKEGSEGDGANETGKVVELDKATVVIEKINNATSAEEVAALLGNDDRKTVMDAAAKKTASFSAE